jgi:hypothetical protein
VQLSQATFSKLENQMAVGAVSSLQSLQNLKQAALVQAPATSVVAPEPSNVLRSGEVMSTSLEALKDPNAKVYRHMIPGANFVMPDGLELVFLGGQLITNDPEVIRQLDAVANKAASMIYTDPAATEALRATYTQAAADAADTAGKTAQ